MGGGVQEVGELAFDENVLDGGLRHLDLVDDVTFAGNCLTLQFGSPVLREAELLQILGQFVADSESHPGTVAVADVDLQLSVGVEAPLVAQAGHLDVLQEARVLAPLVLLVYLLDSQDSGSTVLLGGAEGVAGLEGRGGTGVVDEGVAEVERPFVPLQGFELSLEGIDFIDDGLGVVFDPDWPCEVGCFDGVD